MFKPNFDVYFGFQDKNPLVANYYKLRGTCYEEMNEFDSAISDYYQATKNDPQNENIRTRLRKTIFDLGKFNENIDSKILRCRPCHFQFRPEKKVVLNLNLSDDQ